MIAGEQSSAQTQDSVFIPPPLRIVNDSVLNIHPHYSIMSHLHASNLFSVQDRVVVITGGGSGKNKGPSSGITQYNLRPR